MAINERLVHTASAAAGGGAVDAEQGLILHLDANDVDSYDGDGEVWYDISEYDVTIPLSDNADALEFHINPSDSTSYGGSGNTITDLTGNYTVTKDSAISFDIDNGGYFDKTKTDGITTNYSPDNLTEFTAEVWVNPNSGYQNVSTLFTCVDSSNNNRLFNMYLRGSQRQIQFLTQYSGNYVIYNPVGTTPVQYDKWQHLVLTCKNNGNMVVYLDGEVKSTLSFPHTMSTSVANLEIGHIPSNSSYGFNGQMGAVRFYSKQLSASEVGQNYRHGRDYIYTDLAGTPFLHYDPANHSSYGGTGTTLTDLAGNNNGDLLGGIENSYDEELGNWFDITGSGDGVTTSSPVSINPNTDGMTVEMWFKIDSNTQNYLFSFDGTDTTYMGLSYRSNVNQVAWFYRTGAAANDNLYSSTISLNTWYHLVATTDGSTGQLYINGQLVDSSTSAPYSKSYNEDLHFGNMYDLAQNTNTQIGQIRFYKGGLTQDGVMQNYLFTKPSYPNGINADRKNTPTWNSSGYWDFSGGTSNCDSFFLPQSLTLNPWFTNTHTVSMWVNFDSFTSYPTFWATYDYAGGSYGTLLRADNDGRIRQTGYFNNSPTNQFSSVLSTGQWYHVVGSFSQGDCRLYIDKVHIGTSTATFNYPSGGGRPAIGALRHSSATTTDNGHDGKISKFKLYDRFLTTDEIEILYDEGY